MNLAKPAAAVFFCLLTATGGAFAQDSWRQPCQRTELSVRTTDIADTFERLLRDAGGLIKGGKPAEAYAMLEPFEFEHSGDARFDYLIGIAALDSGKPGMATFAFERVLAMNPDDAVARLEMACAYYQLGDLQRARSEFAAVLAQDPSAAVRDHIRKYLDDIDAHSKGKRTRFAAYVEGGLGRDGNVNVSTSQQQVFVDVFATMATLDSSNVKVADNYHELAAGGEVDHGLNANWGLYAGADLRKRSNNTHAEFDADNTDMRAGIMYEAQADRWRVSVLSGRYHLGGSHNSDTSGFKGEWRHRFSQSNQLNAFAQSVKYRYIDSVMQPNDFDQRAFGLGLLHVLPEGGSSLSGSVYFGDEKDVSPIITVASPSGGRNDGAKSFWGMRIGGLAAINDETTLFATAGMQTGDYRKTNYYFQRQRHDRLADLTMGANWRWDKLWTVRPQLNYSRNNSNIEIYGYDRKAFSLTIRRNLP